MTLRGATLFDGEPRSAREDGNPASNVRFPAMRETSHVYLTAVEVAKLAELCDTGTGQAVSLRDRQRPGPVDRSVPIPERLVSILERRTMGRAAGEPSIVSPKGSRLGLENWKRAVGWPIRTAELGRPPMRVHDLRHTYASLARSAGADMKLLQVKKARLDHGDRSHVRRPLRLGPRSCGGCAQWARRLTVSADKRRITDGDPAARSKSHSL
jgi:integrase